MAAGDADGANARLGFIGLGDIGLPMAMRLHECGHDLMVWNRTASRSKLLAEQGVAIAGTAAELAEACEIVCLCLLNADAIEAVVFGPDGIAEAKSAPRLVIDHSTISPRDTIDFAERLEARTGAAWLDAPVSGGPAGARAGSLAVMAGGRAADFEVAAPVLHSLGRRVTHVGGLGMGQTAKACNQIIGFTITAAIGEGFACARSAGLPPAELAEIMAGGLGDSAALAEFRRASAAGEAGGIKGLIEAYIDLVGGHARPDYAGKLDILHKDIGIAREIAGEAAPRLRLLDQVEAMARSLNSQ